MRVTSVTQVLEAMWDESISLFLTPQAFSNIIPGANLSLTCYMPCYICHSGTGGDVG
jgi:hypothetical protein